MFSLVKSGFFRFLHDLGVPSDELGAFITKNPWIFKEDLDDLQVRVNYLQSKKFSAEMIARIVRRNPCWLSFRYSMGVQAKPECF